MLFDLQPKCECLYIKGQSSILDSKLNPGASAFKPNELGNGQHSTLNPVSESYLDISINVLNESIRNGDYNSADCSFLNAPPSVHDLPPPSVHDLPPPSVHDLPPPSVHDLPPPSVHDLPTPALSDISNISDSNLSSCAYRRS